MSYRQLDKGIQSPGLIDDDIDISIGRLDIYDIDIDMDIDSYKAIAIDTDIDRCLEVVGI